MNDSKLDQLNINLELYLCADVCSIVEQYYYGLRVEYISENETKAVELIPGRKLTYDTKRRYELVSITGDGVYYLEEFELFKDCIKLVELPKHVIVTVNDMSNMFSCNMCLVNVDLNNWDVSSVTNMSMLFANSNFNGDISNWDMRGVKDISNMFAFTIFNGDISNWDVSSVIYMNELFYDAGFNGDIGNWNVSSVEDMRSMFAYSNFNCDISRWDVSSVKRMEWIFINSKFNKDTENWDVSNVEDI